jgi:hypothetical protein
VRGAWKVAGLARLPPASAPGVATLCQKAVGIGKARTTAPLHSSAIHFPFRFTLFPKNNPEIPGMAEFDPLLSRRGMLQAGVALSGAAVAGSTSSLVAATAFAPPSAPQEPAPEPAAVPGEQTTDTPDRQAIMAAGLTAEEAECWRLTAAAAGAFFALKDQHPSEKAEVTAAIHIVQNILLSRPTYRKYIETHKAMEKEKKEKQD